VIQSIKAVLILVPRGIAILQESITSPSAEGLLGIDVESDKSMIMKIEDIVVIVEWQR
jgi:hypothetical protein